MKRAIALVGLLVVASVGIVQAQSLKALQAPPMMCSAC